MLTGSLVFALGLRGALLHPASLGRVLAINVSGAGVFLVLVSLAYRGPRALPDPLPHTLVLTGIVVAVSATVLALPLISGLLALLWPCRSGGIALGTMAAAVVASAWVL